VEGEGKRLVELHGGRITAHSEGAGTGAEFIVRLPVSIGPMTPGLPATSAREGTEASVRGRVLVVDDKRGFDAFRPPRRPLASHATG